MSWVESIDYLQISGILVGQFVLGFCADALGRRTVQIFDAFVMLIGLILLTSVSSPSLNGFVIALAWSFFVYGIGVGGEYVHGEVCDWLEYTLHNNHSHTGTLPRALLPRKKRNHLPNCSSAVGAQSSSPLPCRVGAKLSTWAPC